jgi:hypothetical protein
MQIDVVGTALTTPSLYKGGKDSVGVLITPGSAQAPVSILQ